MLHESFPLQATTAASRKAKVGSAVYGAFKGIEHGDATAFAAIGLGALEGAGVSATIGGIGLSFGGSAFGIGMGSMTAMGGIFGLGIYGLAKMFSSSSTSEPIAETFNRMEEIISDEEAYYQAMIDLNPIFAELSWEQKFAELELEEELEILKKQIKAKLRNNYMKARIFIIVLLILFLKIFLRIVFIGKNSEMKFV
ncbi:hypothetical protein IQ238_02095 [Pleurocapsales cyanobacterium LEGE 06147]|nr:hypothetical protein [Pleurocapsales cyanobacterium LEGE 06147]